VSKQKRAFGPSKQSHPIHHNPSYRVPEALDPDEKLIDPKYLLDIVIPLVSIMHILLGLT